MVLTYMALLGRPLRESALNFQPETLVGPNLYDYVDDNPINHRDHLGLEPAFDSVDANPHAAVDAFSDMGGTPSTQCEREAAKAAQQAAKKAADEAAAAAKEAARKLDKKFIKNLVKKHNLDKCQQETLHRAISKKGLSPEEIEGIAEDIANGTYF